MNRIRPYINRFVKQKEQDIEDSYHSINLKEMKPVTCKHMNHNETILINNSKRQMIKQVRDIEIERENKVLLQKISSVMSKKGSYSVNKTKNIRTKVNKSLNQFYRKRQMEEIQIENKRFVQRLQQKKPTLNMDKINRDWLDNKSVIKRMANFQFNLTSIKSTSRVRSITSEKFYKTQYEKSKVTRFKNIDGQKMLIKVEFINQILKITGDSQNSKELKVIQIPKEQAILFIEKDCQGKMENIVDKLKFDAPTETLYLVSDHLEEEEHEANEFNPQIDKIVSKKKEEVKNKKEDKKVKSKESIESEKKSIKSEKKSQKKIEVQEEKKEESEKKSIEAVEQKKESSQKASQKKIEPQVPLEKEAPVEEPKIQSLKQSKGEHVVEAQKEAIEPQEEKYEEENFEESANITPEEKKKTEPKDEVKPPLQEQKKEEKPQVIVAPQEAEDYKQQFQEGQKKQETPEQPQPAA